jgi:6-phosphofructokinase
MSPHTIPNSSCNTFVTGATFGFETARQHGFEIVHSLMEDSRTTHRWYFVVVMGRTAGHLALGVAKPPERRFP